MTARPTTYRYRTLGWLTFAAALAYLCRNAVGVAESTIREDLGLTLEQSGWFMGAFFWTYALFQVPSGWLSQHYGTRIALTGFALAWSVATIGLGVAPGFWLLIVAQLLMGVAQAGIFPASCNSIGHWMPLAQRSLACGILAAGMQVGAITAGALTGELMIPFGWRGVFILYAVPGLLWAATFAARFRDWPEQSPGVNDQELELILAGRGEDELESQHEMSELAAWRAIATSPVIWMLCGQQICRAAGYMFFASWFPTFLQETRGVSVRDSGYLQGLVLTGTLTGAISGGTLTDWIWLKTGNLRLSRSGVGAAFLGGCAVLILCAWFVKSAVLAVVLLTAGAFFAALAGPCAFATTIDIGGTRVPQVFGLMNMSGNFAAAACPVLVGMLFRWTANWNLVLLLFAGVYFTGAICWAFVNPQRTIGVSSNH
ncbi:putative sulfoacetate transporter SauU [Maioricimonas rarisocia]|uniref:Putative sulfoacetate transporter SauU n=1 Tax=Maioricimonas rarisocia TaxID=2528026 RepID=A0A517Z0X4_9PLAN|nr:MFS transporter [Maioricimonas rarisocia]QDU36123.1 putative sulfoacetate transporter SauU [Maioricimonas rarisocia]